MYCMSCILNLYTLPKIGLGLGDGVRNSSILFANPHSVEPNFKGRNKRGRSAQNRGTKWLSSKIHRFSNNEATKLINLATNKLLSIVII